jgi:hypothetical protein
MLPVQILVALRGVFHQAPAQQNSRRAGVRPSSHNRSEKSDCRAALRDLSQQPKGKYARPSS